jgi:hypothetical protein
LTVGAGSERASTGRGSHARPLAGSLQSGPCIHSSEHEWIEGPDLGQIRMHGRQAPSLGHLDLPLAEYETRNMDSLEPEENEE